MPDRPDTPAAPATEAPPFDIRQLTDDQRSLADDIASAMDFGHEDTCAVWWEDPDGCSCPLLVSVASGLVGARIVEVTQEWGYDPSTGRGDRLHRQSFNPHPLSEREATQQAAALTTEALAEAIGEATGIGVQDTEHGREYDIEGARAILARLPAAAARPEIDVERLARAMVPVLNFRLMAHPVNNDLWRQLAQAIAAEYARLASPEGDDDAQGVATMAGLPDDEAGT